MQKVAVVILIYMNYQEILTCVDSINIWFGRVLRTLQNVKF